MKGQTRKQTETDNDETFIAGDNEREESLRGRETETAVKETENKKGIMGIAKNMVENKRTKQEEKQEAR